MYSHELNIRRQHKERYQALTGRTAYSLHAAGSLLLTLAALALAGPAVALSDKTAPGVSLGPFEQGVYDGTEPFSTTEICDLPGKDCSNNNNRVRTNDVAQFVWSVATTGLDDATPNLDSVIVEQILVPSAGARIRILDIPVACLPAPAGTGGSSPASSISESDDGSLTLSCNLGTMGSGEQRSFSVAVQPLVTSPNDSFFTSSQQAWGLDSSGARVTEKSAFVSEQQYTISAAPAYDLIGDRVGMSRGETIVRDIGRGPESGFVFQYTAHVAAAQDGGARGISTLGAGYSFTPGVQAWHQDGETPFDLLYAVTGCEANRFDWPRTVYGDETYNPAVALNRKVPNSGDCDIDGDIYNGFTLSVVNTDTRGARFPQQTLDGTPLAAGPYFVAAHSIEIFVPAAELDRTDGIIGDNRGQMVLGACLSNFDPDSEAGVSNFLDQVEPGYNGSLMPDGSASNNCAERTIAQLSTDGQFSFRAVSAENDAGNLTSYQPLISGFHAGDGLGEPGQSYGTLLFFNNNSSKPLSHFRACTVFDRTLQRLTDRGNIGASEGTYAYEGNDNPAGFNPDQWQLQYGIAAISDDDPLDANGDGKPDLDAATGRYQGQWSRLRGLRCDSPTITWLDAPDAETLEQINIVRYRPFDNSTQLLPGQEIRLVVPLSLREHFNGGPHAGEPIPTGTVAAAFGSFRSDEFMPGWNLNSYTPAPENTSADGDRMTIVRAQLAVATATAIPAALPGVVESLQAGNTVVWQLEPAVTSTAFDAESVDNVTVSAILSQGTQYNASCTATSPWSATPASVEADTPQSGQTRLTWALESVTANSTLLPITLCADTAPILPAGTSVSVSASISADNAVTSRTQTQEINLGQSGAILASVDTDSVFTPVGGSMYFTLQWRNFSSTTPIQKPVVINVLPFNGDSDSSSARNPGSAFSGSVTLTSEPEVSYSGGVAASAAGTLLYTADAAETVDHDPQNNSSNWCTYSEGDFVATDDTSDCPATWTDVTAIRFNSAHDLDPAGDARSAVDITYSIDALGNQPGDRYINSFAVDSASLPVEQFLVSRQGGISVVDFSISGRVFAAIGGDFTFDEDEDAPVPDGIEIQLIDSATSSLQQTTTTLDGNYQFSALIPGDYVVFIPPSVFAQSGDLPGWGPARIGNAVDPDIDPGFDNASIDGVRTLTITVVSTPTSEAATPSPVVDLALQPNDADGDGIPDIIEFGGTGFINGSIDTDGDGTPDYIDTDSDGDGIPDAEESTTDTDGDGLPDYIDTDSDADGLTDELEGTDDSDGDGIPDYIDGTDDYDADGDGIADSIEGSIDTDGDGIPNNQDTDSDADGISDREEKNTDTDGDGIPNYIDTDSDADNVPDSIEGTADVNGNGVPDYIDNETDADSDKDGIADFIEGGLDTDGDGIADLLDLDSDGDGIPDRIETVEDSDGDGQPNYVDLDSDNDSIPDQIETATDSDSDGVADFLDLDSDNDGIFDVSEAGRTDDNHDGKLDNIVDANVDGIDDALQQSASHLSVIDTDADGVPDYVDVDSDNDFITDLIETRGVDVDIDRDGRADEFIDEIGDGVTETTLWTAGLFTIDLDQDADGAINPVDLDSDGDERSDLTESGQIDRNGDSIVDAMTDSDRDAIQDLVDVDQTGGSDADADGIDDRSDIDFVIGTDTDGDGIADSVDADADGNGHADPTFSDPELGRYPDRDGDGVPDFQQPISGILFSGVGGEGIGCSVQTGVQTSATRDPSLLLMLLLSILYLGVKRSPQARAAKDPAQQA